MTVRFGTEFSEIFRKIHSNALIVERRHAAASPTLMLKRPQKISLFVTSRLGMAFSRLHYLRRGVTTNEKKYLNPVITTNDNPVYSGTVIKMYVNIKTKTIS